jgi:hypothetical protein
MPMPPEDEPDITEPQRADTSADEADAAEVYREELLREARAECAVERKLLDSLSEFVRVVNGCYGCAPDNRPIELPDFVSVARETALAEVFRRIERIAMSDLKGPRK